MKKRTLLLLTALLAAVGLVFRANSLQTLHHWLDYLMQFITRDTLPLPLSRPTGT